VRTLLRRLHPVRWLPMPKTWRLRWYLARANRSYDREVKKARQKGATRDALEGIQQGWWADTDELNEELEELRTRRLLRQAYRLDVPVPLRPIEQQHNEFWEQGHMTGSWYLTTAGINKVRTDIRTEIRARQETRAYWLRWVAAITGLVGALTGLVAVLSK